MAIYHLTVKIGSKDKGHSASSKNSYITRTDAYDKKADECVHKDSGNMPKWPKTNPQADASHYWKAADTYERDNGRLYREIEFAIPRELKPEQRIELCKSFAEKLATLEKGQKLPYTFAIHTDPKSPDHNPHCHLMISERINDGLNRNASTWFKRANPKDPKKGGAVKTQDLKGKQWLEPTRELWATMANEAIKSTLTGKNEYHPLHDSIDHRSFKTRGIEAFPTQHLGAKAQGMIERGIPCERGEKINRLNKTFKAVNNDSRLKPKSFLSRIKINCTNTPIKPTKANGEPKTFLEMFFEFAKLIQQIMEMGITLERMKSENIMQELANGKTLFEIQHPKPPAHLLR